MVTGHQECTVSVLAAASATRVPMIKQAVGRISEGIYQNRRDLDWLLFLLYVYTRALKASAYLSRTKRAESQFNLTITDQPLSVPLVC